MKDMDPKKVKASMDYAMQAIKQVPRDDMEEFEAHLTATLIVFWGALWGTFGTEYAKGFIEAQLRGMEPDKEHERFTEPLVQ